MFLINPYRFNSNAYTVSRLSVKYSNTNYSYLTSGPLTDEATFNTGSNTITSTTISPNLASGGGSNANTGLCYDILHDWLWVRDFDGIKAYDKSLSVQRNFSLPGSAQGLAFDPIENKLYEWESGSTVKVYNTDTGALITTITINQGGQSSGSITFDIFNNKFYLNGEHITSQNPVRRYSKDGSTLTFDEETWWGSSEGLSFDYLRNKFLNQQSSFVSLRRYDGLDQKLYPRPVNSASVINFEQTAVDGRDGTFWMCFPGYFHGGINNGNRLFHFDPIGVYQKYLFFPDMIRYDKFKVTGSIQGELVNQSIQSSDWSLSPVIDFQSFTEQQTLSNWTSDDDFEIEFRGSASAPSTASEPSGHLNIYDANGTSDGWGSTTPGAWQSTPVTNRYLQFRIKPVAPDEEEDEWTPADLGSKLKRWYEFNEETGLVVEKPTNLVQLAFNLVNPGTGDLVQSGAASLKPTYNTAGLYTADDSGDAMAMNNTSEILSDTQGELTIVGRREATTSIALYLAAAHTTSNVNQLGFYHYNTAGLVPSGISIRQIEPGGTVNQVSVVNTSLTFKMISYQSNGSAYKIYLDKVDQALTVNFGSNNGNWFADISPNNVNFGFLGSLSSFNGVSRIRLIVYTNAPLTDQERSDLFDYATRHGMLL